MFEEDRCNFLKIVSSTLLFYFLEAFPYCTHSFFIVFDNSNALLILVDELPQPVLDEGLGVSGLILLLCLSFSFE